jgi:murein DD-endopeptidase MepM/ murein hydrolase activator NlpD
MRMRRGLKSLSFEKLDERLAPSGDLPWPVTPPANQSMALYSTYGQYQERAGLELHAGIDIAVPANTQVRSIE